MTVSEKSLDETYRADCHRCFGLCCIVMAHVPSNGFPEEKPANSRCRNLTHDNRCAVFDSLESEGYKVCRAYDCFGAGPMVSAWIEADGAAAPESGRLEEFRILSRLRLLAVVAWERYLEGDHQKGPVFEALESVGARYRRAADLSLDFMTRDILRENENWVTEVLSRLTKRE